MGMKQGKQPTRPSSSSGLFPALTRHRVDAVLSRLPELPRDLRFGASTAGYQVEGGFNEPGGPANNWLAWEQTGRVPRTGLCSDFWRRWPEDLDLAKRMGLTSFRLGVEWARLERSPDRPGGRVQLDEPALRGYARILAGCHERGLMPAVTLHHFTHPHHEGQELWLDGERGVERIVPYATAAVDALNGLLVTEHKAPPLPYFITINEPFMYAAGTHLAGMFPGPGRRWGMAAARRVLENLHLAHIGLYRGIHALYRERGWPPPTVTFNPWASTVFEADLMLVHMLMAPARGVPQSRLTEHLAEEKQRFEEEVDSAVHGKRTLVWLRRLVERTTRWAARRNLGPERFGRLVEAVYAGPPGERLLDAIGLDFYDPYFGNYLDPGWPLGFTIRRFPWTWRQVPAALPAFLRAYGRAGGGLLPVDLLEQGMGHRCTVGGAAHPREEGMQRGALLRAGILGCLAALADGVPVTGYYHWSLMDNYEWGSFEPRFGIHGVVYEDGARRLPTDIAGEDVAAQYGRISEALQAGDRVALAAALADPEPGA